MRLPAFPVLFPALGLAFLALATTPATPAAPDWTKRVAVSPIGGYVMGNPAAATRLVEYISYTCIHCANFTRQAGAALKIGWVRGGGVSVEVRNAVRDRFDLTAAILARCGGQAKFFDNHMALFANYDAWMQRIAAYQAAAGDQSAMDEGRAMADIAERTGLNQLMMARGFTRKQLGACIADKAARARVLAMADEAWNQRKIGGTPGFTINGNLVDIRDWDALKAALPAAAS